MPGQPSASLPAAPSRRFPQRPRFAGALLSAHAATHLLATSFFPAAQRWHLRASAWQAAQPATAQRAHLPADVSRLPGLHWVQREALAQAWQPAMASEQRRQGP